MQNYHPEYNIAEVVELPSYSEESRKKHSDTKKKMYAECKKQLEKAIQIAAKTSNEKIHQRISKELDKIKRLIK